ncbi:hypothetical protein GF382_03535 [Candidatus Falkowbacteria bacterium]|nr:hypothetical protein [Candidatus Falkowbacteria bacterium]
MNIGNLEEYQQALSSNSLEDIREASRFLRRLEKKFAYDSTKKEGLDRRRQELRDAYLGFDDEKELDYIGLEEEDKREISRLNALLEE